VLAYLFKRLISALLVALTVSAITFSMTFLTGDPAITLGGETATQEDLATIREFYGYDKPIPVQFFNWLGNAVQGDLGHSHYLNQPVATEIFTRLPTTMTLGFCALLFALVLAIPLGVVAAIRPNSLLDRIALGVAVVGQAMPSFWFALTMMLWFSINWGILPVSGTDTWAHFVMPSIALGYYITPGVMRLTRAGMLEVLQSDYIRTARAKGVSRFSLLFKHALRNAIIPVVSLAAVQFGFMLGGSIVIETIFAINGLGFLAWESIQRADLPMMQAIVLILSLFYIMLTYFADAMNAWLDPRIRVA